MDQSSWVADFPSQNPPAKSRDLISLNVVNPWIRVSPEHFCQELHTVVYGPRWWYLRYLQRHPTMPCQRSETRQSTTTLAPDAWNLRLLFFDIYISGLRNVTEYASI